MVVFMEKKSFINLIDLIMDKEAIVSDDYINSEGITPCYDVQEGSYAISSNGEDLFASDTELSTVIVSVSNDSKLLVNGNLEYKDAYKFLYENNFLDNCDIYVYSSQNMFDYINFSKMIEDSNLNAKVTPIPSFEISGGNESIEINKDSILLSNGLGDVLSYKLESKENINTK